MRLLIRILLTGLIVASSGGARAEPANPMPAVRANNWAEAEADAAQFADPVAAKLVLYYRLRAPGAATAAEIADFMRRNPDWPDQGLLEYRREEAIAADPDDTSVLAQCRKVPHLAAAMLRCAKAMKSAGHTHAADALARKAWVNAINTPAQEASFLRDWGGIATEADEWARFERLAWFNTAAAARQAQRLSPADRAVAEARLAARRDQPNAEALIAALPKARRDDPGLMLDRIRALVHADQDQQAAALLAKTPDAGNKAAYWAERAYLARKLLREGHPKQAYAVVVANTQISDAGQASADFLAGFIALRMLHDPALARPHFLALTHSTAVITEARAYYWLGRTAAASGADPRPDYRKATSWPTTFYGQLAALALGEKPATLIDRLHDPVWTKQAALAFTRHEVLRAAAWLIAWDQPDRARAFIARMDQLAPTTAERVMTAAFALHAGLPEDAVFIARRMGHDGILLPRLGWPAPFHPAGPPDPAFSLGIMRQESSFDVGAVSPSGARGLMQLMPPTAREVGRKLGIRVSVAGLTENPRHNIALGTAYLQEMLTRFGNNLPLAAAAYNAGPRRVAEWLQKNGDPRIGPVDMVDWIEMIPAAETRNYVQRVVENVTIYRALRHEPAPILRHTPWTR